MNVFLKHRFAYYHIPKTAGVTIKEYLSNLEKNHEEWLMNKNDILILDGNQNFKDDKIIQDYYLTLFETYLQNLRKTF